MKTKVQEFASAKVKETAVRMGELVRATRVGRNMPQADLAARARTSVQTVMRIEAGSVSTSLGAWLSVMEQLGMTRLLSEVREPVADYMLFAQKNRRARLKKPDDDLDF